MKTHCRSGGKYFQRQWLRGRDNEWQQRLQVLKSAFCPMIRNLFTLLF